MSGTFIALFQKGPANHTSHFAPALQSTLDRGSQAILVAVAPLADRVISFGT